MSLGCFSGTDCSWNLGRLRVGIQVVGMRSLHVLSPPHLGSHLGTVSTPLQAILTKGLKWFKDAQGNGFLVLPKAGQSALWSPGHWGLGIRLCVLGSSLSDTESPNLSKFIFPVGS